MHRAGRHADDRGGQGEQQPEQYRNSQTVDQPGQHVAALVIGTQPVFGGRRGWGRHRQVVVDGAVAKADRWPEHPTIFVDQLGQIRIAVVGGAGKHAAEVGFSVVLEHGDIERTVMVNQQRAVVGDEFRAQAQAEQQQEQPQRPPATAVGPELRQPAAGQGGEVKPGLFHAAAILTVGPGTVQRRRSRGLAILKIGRLGKSY